MAVEARSVQVASAPVSSYDTQITQNHSQKAVPQVREWRALVEIRRAARTVIYQTIAAWEKGPTIVENPAPQRACGEHGTEVLLESTSLRRYTWS